MTRSTWAYLTCDECNHQREQEAVSVDYVASSAARDGWSIREDRDDRRDLCPVCVEREGDT